MLEAIIMEGQNNSKMVSTVDNSNLLNLCEGDDYGDKLKYSV